MRIIFLFIVLLMASCGPARYLKTVAKAEKNNHHFTGLAVFDPTTGKTLFQHNANKYFTPASNIKVFTLYTAMSFLGDSLPAFLYAQGNDTLWVKALGSPIPFHPKFPQDRTANFLRNAPQKTIAINTPFKDRAYAPGWAWDDYPYYFMPERSAFPVFGNTVTAYRVGDSIVTQPSFMKSLFSSEKMPVERALHANIFAADAVTSDTLQIPFITSDSQLVQILSDELKKEVVTTKAMPSLPQKTFFSIPSKDIYTEMMHESDNFLAEQLLAMYSSQLSDSLSISEAIKHAQRTLFKGMPQPPRWVDGSGLSRYNLATPNSMVWVLDRLRVSVPKETLFSIFPTGGASGTLKTMFTGKEPFVYAKTGTLTNNYCLSGYLKTKKGKILIFSYMANHYRIPVSEIKKEIEVLLTQLHERY